MNIDRWDAGYDHYPDQLDPDGKWVLYADYVKGMAAMQARIDELMLEYCPDEMSDAQFDEWARHQQPVDESIAYTITAAGREHLDGGGE